MIGEFIERYNRASESGLGCCRQLGKQSGKCFGSDEISKAA